MTMTSDDKNTMVIEIDANIIESAQAALEQLSKIVTEKIEKWVYLGRVEGE
jgi:hypothetical protein